MIEVPTVVRNKALAAGAGAWLNELPSIIEAIEADWSIEVGASYEGATEALVARAHRSDGSDCVLKLMIPRLGNHAENEIKFLELADGKGCAQLLSHDAKRGALLLERLGRSLYDLRLPIEERHEILCRAAMKIWRPSHGCGLPTGAAKAQWLAGFIKLKWEELGHPCTERAVAMAITDATRRRNAHDDERSVLVHGDIHQWNALEASTGDQATGHGEFKLVDPDGLVAEPEYDMGILMREDPGELLEGDTTALSHERAHWLAARTSLDPKIIWQWGNIERVSTGLLLTEIDLQPVGRQMLEVSDRIAADMPAFGSWSPPA